VGYSSVLGKRFSLHEANTVSGAASPHTGAVNSFDCTARTTEARKRNVVVRFVSEASRILAMQKVATDNERKIKT
jgi:uncharacterized protein (DUF927 family)